MILWGGRLKRRSGRPPYEPQSGCPTIGKWRDKVYDYSHEQEIRFARTRTYVQTEYKSCPSGAVEVRVRVHEGCHARWSSIPSCHTPMSGYISISLEVQFEFRPLRGIGAWSLFVEIINLLVEDLAEHWDFDRPQKTRQDASSFGWSGVLEKLDRKTTDFAGCDWTPYRSRKTLLWSGVWEELERKTLKYRDRAWRCPVRAYRLSGVWKEELD